MVAIASGGVTYLSVKACNEIHALHNESTLVETNVQLAGEGLGV
ncbi:hypothetical protein [Wolbachia endosymbiont (group A) of Andrena hattorfiana]|nr:hypothetical protein [Wolbachia endosymbiont (group A) of Andrena hattorfiana]